MASEIEAIIFDYDGVVATLDKELALQAAIPHSQSFLIPAEVVLTDLFYDEAQNYPLDLGQVTIEEVREAMRRIAWKGEVTEWFNWWAFVDDCFRISPPMRELLKYLSERYQLALLTDNHIGFRKWLQHRPDIGQYFDIVVCSAEQKVKKPDSQIYLYTVAALGTVYSKALYIDDHLGNVKSAQKLGMNSIHMTTIEQTYNDLQKYIELPDWNSMSY